MKNGGEHWQWDSKIPCYFGVLPRYGAKGSDVKVGVHGILQTFTFRLSCGPLVVSFQELFSRTRS
jgi:hypothetical protein